MSYFVERHLPLCRSIPGLTSAHYSFDVAQIEGPGRWFCVFEAQFPDHATLKAVLATPQAQRAAEDVQNYSPETPTSLIYEAVSVTQDTRGSSSDDLI
jgi:uncharacterized protein (TIGR02118 family)